MECTKSALHRIHNAKLTQVDWEALGAHSFSVGVVVQ